MLDHEILNPFYLSEDKGFYGVKREIFINFLETLSDEDMRKLGNTITLFFPRLPIDYSIQFVNNRKENVDYSFADDYIKRYNLPLKRNLKDRYLAKSLSYELRIKSDTTAKEFIEKYNV